MYAKNSQTNIYHLLTENEETTLCGLAVIPIIIDRPIQSNAVHLTSRQPPGQRICEQCVSSKAKTRRSGAGG